tara:strand:- start:852 stop:1265 length:414 start_codon:yes stop_codon:yes gene_type:complete
MKTVFTNGCFDILHQGHLDLLNNARKYGDRLVVGINSDESIKRLKGSRRPINNQDFRSNLLLSLKCIDKVLIFNEDTPINLIMSINPDILIKGGDYKKIEVVGSKYVSSYGGKTIILPLTKGFSTTAIIEKILNKYR